MMSEGEALTKKRKVAASAVEASLSGLQRLSSNPDVMKFLGQFLCPSSMHSMPLNELRRPSLLLTSCSCTVLTFVEKCNQPGLWRVSSYMVETYYDPDVEYHCQPASQSTTEFLKALIKSVYIFQKGFTRGTQPEPSRFFCRSPVVGRV